LYQDCDIPSSKSNPVKSPASGHQELSAATLAAAEDLGHCIFITPEEVIG